MALDLVSFIVDDYDTAIAWFTSVLGFALVEDTPSLTTDGRTKRRVIVRPPDGHTGLLLAKADGDAQRAAIGAQFAGRVGLFLRVADFASTLARLRAAQAEVIGEPREEAYGRVVVFRDPWGNKWDLLGPRP